MAIEAEALLAILKQHIKVDATGLSPAVASAFVTGFDEAVEAIRSALAEDTARAAEGWEPIETAPKDGAWILGWQTESYSYGGKPANVVRWYHGMWTAWAESDSKDPTHWRPLPAPPALPLTNEAADANR